MTLSSPAALVPLPVLVLGVLGGGTAPGLFFSVDYEGPRVGQPDSAMAVPITEGDVLRPFGGAPVFAAAGPPQIALEGGQFGIVRYPNCVGHPAGSACGIELDALSFGVDPRFRRPPPPLPRAGAGLPLEPHQQPRHWFSIDEHAVGRTPAANAPPNVQSEAPFGDASADVFVERALPAPPLDVPAVADGHVGALDGNGLPSGSGFTYRGLGLIEPNPPTPTPPDPGDDLDALTIAPFAAAGSGVYFSLDAAFVDPLTGVANGGSAALQGVAPGAILKGIPGGGASVWAPAPALGLDLVGGPGSDDLDALVVWENGNGSFDPPSQAYAWDPPSGPPSDMVLFSVRRGSAVIGRPDSLFGRAIEPGDVLMPPVAGGLSAFPAIFVAAENFALATARTDGVAFGDELDALALSLENCFDCNNNGVEDAVDIANGYSSDANHNGIPDECERSLQRFCFCATPLGPCGNDDTDGGCTNSSGNGAELDATATSTTSVFADDLVLHASQLPHLTIGIFFMGQNTTQLPFGDGLLCVAPPTHRLGAVATGSLGVAERGPGLVAYVCSVLPPGACIDPGETWNFQFWFRNVVGPCGNGFNTTNALEVVFTP